MPGIEKIYSTTNEPVIKIAIMGPSIVIIEIKQFLYACLNIILFKGNPFTRAVFIYSSESCSSI